MHMDLRALTFRYLVPRKHDFVKNPESLTQLVARKSTLGGKVDKQKDVELAFWTAANANDGITDEQVSAAAEKFVKACLLYTSPSPRDQRGSRMPSSA